LCVSVYLLKPVVGLSDGAVRINVTWEALEHAGPYV
jgi:hypothetical protein